MDTRKLLSLIDDLLTTASSAVNMLPEGWTNDEAAMALIGHIFEARQQVLRLRVEGRLDGVGM